MLFKAFWRYWTWLCVALVTSAAILALIAGIVLLLKSAPAAKDDRAAQCLDKGGTWNAEDWECRFPA